MDEENLFTAPKSETRMTCYIYQGKIAGFATRKNQKPETYCLYLCVNGVWKRITSSKNPLDFDKYIKRNHPNKGE